MNAADPALQPRVLKRIRAVSWPLTALIAIFLGASVLVALLTFAALLGFPWFGSLHSFVVFAPPGGIGVEIGNPGPSRIGYILVEGLTTEQRVMVAGLAAACGSCNILALLQLRGLFALYSRGIVFSTANVTRIKKFGLWLAVTAIVVNVSGRLFVHFLHSPVLGVSNAAQALILGSMIYVIGYVMELAREADLERQEYV